MSKYGPAKIGLFTLVAMAILIGGILIFGGTRWLEPSTRAVLYFEEPVGGLSVGSTVNFRGVRVGEVERLSLELNPETAEAIVVVIVRLAPGEHFAGGVELANDEEPIALQYWIDQGLIAQLNASSLLTGQLSIQLNLEPDAKPTRQNRGSQYPEIPVVRSEVEQVREAIATVDWLGLVERFDSTLVSITELTDTLQQELDGVGENIRATSASTETLVRELRDTLARTETAVSSLASQAESTLNTSEEVIQRVGGDASDTLAGFDRISAEASDTLADISALSQQSNESIEALSAQIEQTLAAIEQLSNQADDSLSGRNAELERVLTLTEQTMTGLNNVVQQLEDAADPRSQERDDIRQTLRNLSDASAALVRIADMIERDPQSIFLGTEGER